jgi:hypothetical protein
MPELSEILSNVLNGAIDAVEMSERTHLMNQLDAVQRLSGAQPEMDELLELLKQGYLPDYFAGTELTISAQLSMATTRQRTTSGSAGGQIGPLAVQGSLTESFGQATQTNVSVTVTLVRQSRNRGGRSRSMTCCGGTGA